MEFSHEYFDDEVREDFYVSGLMKRLWAANLEVISDVAKVCDKYNIRWFADYGTLLGAVRHGGCIPWDDDFDICMLRGDYMRFLEVAEKELPQNYSVLNCHNEYEDLLTRVINTRHPTFEEDILQRYHQCYLGAGIDIFPLDYMAPTKKEQEAHKTLLRAILSFEPILSDENLDQAMLDQVLSQLEQLCGVKFDRQGKLIKQMYEAAEGVCALYGPEQSDTVMLAPIWAKYGVKTYPLTCFQHAIKVRFENMDIWISAEYDKMLQREYGDYMRIIKGGASHAYPCFAEQEAYVRENVSAYPFEYKFNQKDIEPEERLTSSLAQERAGGILNYDNRVQVQIQREVLILPYRASSWKNIEAVWRQERADKTCHVTVILPPYYEKNAFGKMGEMHDESGLLPDYVEVTPYDAYDFEHMLPDVIYTQNPYDECNYTTSVHPFFYARNLRKYTDKLVYIPWFTMRDVNVDNGKVNQTMKYFCTVPGVVLADEVWLPSKSAKEAYVRKLTAFAGEDTKRVWEDKIHVHEVPVCSSDYSNIFEKLPITWKQIIQPGNTIRKQIILYDISSASFVQGRECALQKLKETLEFFEGKRDTVALIWRRNMVTEDVLSALEPEIYKQYQEMVAEYKKAAWGIFDENLSYRQEVELADAYYGDAGYASRYMETLEKPVLLQKIGIFRNVDGQPLVQMIKNEAGKYPYHIRAYAILDDTMYFIPDEMNLLCTMQLEDGMVTILSSMPEEKINQTGLSLKLECYDGKIIVTPYMAKTIWSYDIQSGRWQKIGIRNEEQECKFVSSVIYRDKLYLIPALYKYIVRVNLKTYSVAYLEHIYAEYAALSSEEACRFACNYARCRDVLYIAEQQTNLMLRFELATEKYTWLQIGNPGQIWLASAWDGIYFYFVPLTQDRLLRWDGNDEYVEYNLPENCKYDQYGPVNANIIDGKLVLQGRDCDTILYDLKDMSCHTEPVRYTRAYKIREDFYTGHDMAADRFVIQDGSKRLEYNCAFNPDVLKKYLRDARRAGKIGLSKEAIKEDDTIGIQYFVDCLCQAHGGMQGEIDKKTIVFLPYKASMWDSLESIWLAAKEDPRCECYVVPIPYYDKDSHGRLTTYHYEGAQFPEYVPVTDYRDFDLASRNADIIYIHNPYDDGNHVTSVDPDYYSARLKAYTDKLVYVPYYATSGGMSEAQSLCKAYLSADYIIVQAEGHKDYFDAGIPREKLLALGSPKFDRVVKLCENPPEVSEDWKDKMTGKTVYFFNTSLGGMLADTDAFLKKLRYVFDCFAGRKDACLLWRPHPLLDETFTTARSQYKEEYERLKQNFLSADWGIYDTTPDIEKTIAMSDCYIGDAGTSVTALFGIAGKPVYLLDNYIHREPADEDWSKEMITPYHPQGQDAWKVEPGNQLYHLEKGIYRFYCNLSEYTSGGYYRMAVEHGEYVYVFPANAQEILVIDDKRNITRIKLEQKISQPGAFANVWFEGNYAFLIPYKYPYIVRFDMDMQAIDYVDGCQEFFVSNHAGSDRIGGNGIWNGYLMLANPADNRVVAIDCETLELQVLLVDARYYRGACALQSDGDTIWLFPYTGTNVVQWNPMTGETVTHNCRVPGFVCNQYPTGKTCMERAFGSMARRENQVVLAPVSGNQFVFIDTETGEVKPFHTELDLAFREDQSYCMSGGNGRFVRRLDETHALFYHEPMRKLYRMNLLDGSVEEEAIAYEQSDVWLHAPGYAKLSKWVRYGCEERAICSLPQMLENQGAGDSFDRKACLEAYGEIAMYADGRSGQKIHASMMDELCE